MVWNWPFKSPWHSLIFFVFIHSYLICSLFVHTYLHCTTLQYTFKPLYKTKNTPLTFHRLVVLIGFFSFPKGIHSSKQFSLICQNFCVVLCCTQCIKRLHIKIIQFPLNGFTLVWGFNMCTLHFVHGACGCNTEFHWQSFFFYQCQFANRKIKINLYIIFYSQ